MTPSTVQHGDGEPDDGVFRALADPGRRRLLDHLADHPGETLTGLCPVLAPMTRFGVMKHLGVLETAGLVVVRRDGRHKRHYLNPVPIRRIHDRWISKFAEPWVEALIALATDLESGASIPTHSHDTGGTP